MVRSKPSRIHLRRHFAHDSLMFCDAISRNRQKRLFEDCTSASRCRFVSAAFFCLRRMAPEILLGERYNEKIDVYAFAMVLLELTSRQLPW